MVSRDSSSRVPIESRIERSAVVEIPADQRPHRCEQPGITTDPLGILACRAKTVEPAHFGAQGPDMVEYQDDPDGQNPENKAVQPRIGDEGRMRLTVEDRCDETDDDQEDDHRREEGHRAGEFLTVVSRTGHPDFQVLQLHFRHNMLDLRRILLRRLVEN